MNQKSDNPFDFSTLPQTSFDDLWGRQSVRATFKLSLNCIEAINIVAKQLGIKQKSLFDHLLQDLEALNTIADQVRNARVQAPNRVQKTYVISRSTLLSLEDVAKQFNASRDALIEYSIHRLLPLITNERKRHEQRKVIFAQLKDHVNKGRKLLEATYAQLGENDLISNRLAAAMGVYESAFRQIAAYMEKGKNIESFDADGFEQVDIVFEED
jgi:predicted DNA-binding protein YlxM (UPF0122 family)